MCRKRPGGQGGQAILEYLFLIFFAIVLVSGFVYQFNGAVRDYFDSYFSKGGYLACLIEKGLLPGEENDEGGCDLRKFDIHNGKERPVQSITFTTTKNPEFDTRGSNGSMQAESSRIDERGNSRVVPAGETGSSLNKIAKGGTVSKTGKRRGGNSDSGNAGFENFETSDNGDVASGGEEKGRYVPYKEGENSTVHRKSETVPATDRDLKTAREIAAEKAARKAKAGEEKNVTLSIGNIFRILILIMLLFAIIFFIGSQMVAISRGNRKRA